MIMMRPVCPCREKIAALVGFEVLIIPTPSLQGLITHRDVRLDNKLVIRIESPIPTVCEIHNLISLLLQQLLAWLLSDA